ncbi:MAG TPA: addiction module protein [Candidatus Udaeobacter sp.]|jgi:putative addiction module component (TIGR02574 family)
MGVAEIKQEVNRLTNAERIELTMWLWDSLDDKEKIESPSWHGDVLAERAAKIESGDAKFLTIEELKNRLRT